MALQTVQVPVFAVTDPAARVEMLAAHEQFAASLRDSLAAVASLPVTSAPASDAVGVAFERVGRALCELNRSVEAARVVMSRTAIAGTKFTK